MGDIGEIEKEVIVVPLESPVPGHEVAPAPIEPYEIPQTVPAEPEKVPVGK